MKKNIITRWLLVATVATVAGIGLTTTPLSAQTIINGSFEANTFINPPGTISGNGPVTGWTVGDPAKAGLNPAGGANTYANNGTVPNGTNVLFLQPTNYASTVLSGLSVGTDYSVKFRVNAPVGGAPTLRVALDNNPSLLDAGGVLPVGAAGVAAPWKFVAFNFTATASQQTLHITNNAVALASVLLLDDFTINVSTSGWSVAMWTNDASSGVDNTKFYTHAFAFNQSGAAIAISNVNFTRLSGGNPSIGLPNEFTSSLGTAGPADAGNVLITAGGGSAAMATTFSYNGNPAVLVFNNLIPGRQYVASFYTVGWDALGKVYGRTVTWDAGGDRLTVNQDHFGDNVGTVMSFRYSAPSSGFMVFSNFPLSTTAGTLHTYGAANYEVTSPNGPVIGVQPVNKVSIPGSGAGFYVTAAGAQPLSYQWLKNDAVIPDQINRFLSITNLSAADLAQYSVHVANSFGSVTSSSAGITFSTATIPNPSFEGDSFSVPPGYASGNFPIPGWFISNPGRQGISLAGGSSLFANNGTPPDGRDVAFIQNAGGVSNWLSTIITGLTPGQRYTLDFGANGRAGQVPRMRLNVGGELALHFWLSAVGAVGAPGPYRRVAVDFTPTNSTVELYLTNDAPGDTTALVDDFRIAPSTTKWMVEAWTNDASSGVDNTKFYTHAFNFGSRSDAVINGVIFRGTPGLNPSIPNLYTTAGFGTEFAGPDVNTLTANGGGSAGLASQFLYGGPVQTITLTNLVPGIQYVATIFTVGWETNVDARSATFRVGNDRLTINQDQLGDNVGTRISYPYTADASGSITISYTPTDGARTIHTYGFANYQLTGTEPVIAAQPSSAFVPADETVTLFVALSAGAQPTTYQWQSASGVNIVDQTNATLVLSNLVLGAVSDYHVVISNAFGSVTSVVATVEAGVRFTELFNTGVDDNKVFLPGGVVDLHYQLVYSDDPAFPGPDAVTMHNGAFPLLANYFTNGLFSSWISPRTNSSVGNSNGLFIYRTSFILDSVDPTHAQITGKWASDNEGLDIRLNGVSTGISNMLSGPFTTFYPFTITNGFVAGSNVLEFVIFNSAAGPTALRAELQGVGRPLPSASPQIVSEPQNVLGQEGGSVAFTVLATGSPTLTYQWFYEGIDLQNENTRTLKLTQISKFDQSGSYWVLVDNGVAPAVESAHVTLTINAQPIAGDNFIATGSNQPITFSANKLLVNDDDAPDEDDAVSIIAVSPVSTNSGTATLSGGLVTYTPLAGYVGADLFTYTLGDARDGRATGNIFVTVGATNFISVASPAALLPNGHFQVGYSGVAGYLYTVERATNILGPWQVFTNIAADVNGLFQIDDANTPPEPMRFYRVNYP